MIPIDIQVSGPKVMPVGMSVSLNLVQLITQERFTPRSFKLAR